MPSFSASRTLALHTTRCRQYRARTKGKVEQPVRYLRGKFVYRGTFLHDADLDHQRQLWLDRVANVRVHGPTRERPRDRFDREDGGTLTAPGAFEQLQWGDIFGDDVVAAALIDRLVHHCHLVTVRGHSYRMRQHTELWQTLHVPPDPEPRRPSPPGSSGGLDELRLIPSSICQIFNRRNCQIFDRH